MAFPSISRSLIIRSIVKREEIAAESKSDALTYAVGPTYRRRRPQKVRPRPARNAIVDDYTPAEKKRITPRKTSTYAIVLDGLRLLLHSSSLRAWFSLSS